MMGETESHDFVYKKLYGPESHPKLILTGRLSDQADKPFKTKTIVVSYLFLGLLNKNHIFSHLTLTLMF